MVKKLLRIIPKNFPVKKYKKTQIENKQENHWGQRKLLMNEIELLTKYASYDDVIVYAGSAPGIHIKILYTMFNFLGIHYLLFDPRPFFVKNNSNISTYNVLFTNEIANKFKDKKVIFISDIRREFDSEEKIFEDMISQQRWHLIMKPKVSMFKFGRREV